MSTYDLEEQERIAELKDWWDKWGKLVQLVLAALIVAMVSLWGYREYQKKQGEEAEALFASVQKTAQEAAASKDPKKLSSAAAKLAEQFPSSFFATEAQLLAARTAVENKDFTAAETHLRWVADNGRDLYRNIARVRLASVLLENKQYDEALKQLGEVKEEGFAPLVADLRGDIYSAQGRADEARAAYQVAVDKAEARSALKGISQAKLDAAGGAIADKKEPSAKTDDGKKGAAK